MLPPGISFNAISEKALAASKKARLPRSYWDWQEMLKPNRSGFFPYTPATNLLYALREALHMLHEEGLPNVFRRHERHRGSDSRRGAGLGTADCLRGPARVFQLTHRRLHARRHDADQLRAVILENFDMSLGAGLSKLAGKVFRIGHLGSFNDLMLAGTLSGVEMGLQLAGVPHKQGGVAAALHHLVKTAPKPGVSMSAR